MITLRLLRLQFSSLLVKMVSHKMILSAFSVQKVVYNRQPGIWKGMLTKRPVYKVFVVVRFFVRRLCAIVISYSDLILGSCCLRCSRTPWGM